MLCFTLKVIAGTAGTLYRSGLSGTETYPAQAACARSPSHHRPNKEPSNDRHMSVGCVHKKIFSPVATPIIVAFRSHSSLSGADSATIRNPINDIAVFGSAPERLAEPASAGSLNQLPPRTVNAVPGVSASAVAAVPSLSGAYIANRVLQYSRALRPMGRLRRGQGKRRVKPVWNWE